MSTDADLLPCPFCGGGAHFQRVPDASVNGNGQFVECEDCSASTALMIPLMDPVDDQLLERWNRRPKPSDFGVGMRAEDVGTIVNLHRKQLQTETPTIGDGVTCAAFLLWAMLADAQMADGRDIAESFYDLAEQMPEEAEAMGFRIVRAQ